MRARLLLTLAVVGVFAGAGQSLAQTSRAPRLRGGTAEVGPVVFGACGQSPQVTVGDLDGVRSLRDQNRRIAQEIMNTVSQLTVTEVQLLGLNGPLAKCVNPRERMTREGRCSGFAPATQGRWGSVAIRPRGSVAASSESFEDPYNLPGTRLLERVLDSARLRSGRRVSFSQQDLDAGFDALTRGFENVDAQLAGLMRRDRLHQHDLRIRRERIQGLQRLVTCYRNRMDNYVDLSRRYDVTRTLGDEIDIQGIAQVIGEVSPNPELGIERTAIREDQAQVLSDVRAVERAPGQGDGAAADGPAAIRQTGTSAGGH